MIRGDDRLIVAGMRPSDLPDPGPGVSETKSSGQPAGDPTEEDLAATYSRANGVERVARGCRATPPRPRRS